MRVWMSPKSNRDNKYTGLLSKSLEDKGVEVYNFRWRYIHKLKRNDILHFHWIHGIYQSKFKTFFLMKLLIMLMVLIYFKIINVKVIWTIHNLYPHEYKYKSLEKIARKMMIIFSFKLIVAGNFIKEEVIKEYKVKENKISVIRHGHYRDIYPRNNISLRNKYDIPIDDFVYLFIGAIKPYKGIDKLIKAFSQIKNSNSSLLIAGKPYMNLDDIYRLVGDNKKIYLDLNFISDEEIADIIYTSNAVVLPYDQITTSGSAILALSFDRPVVAPDTSFFREYFNDKTAILYRDKNSVGYLKDAMERAKHLNTNEADFIPIIQELDWDEIANKTIECYLGNLN